MASGESSAKPAISCKPNGPYLVKGLSTLTTSSGRGITTQETIALCRCGGSASKPFCDGSHYHVGFKNEEG